MQHGGMHYGSLERRPESDHRGDIFRTLRRDGAGNDSAEAMTDEVNLATSFLQGFLDGRGQAITNEQVGAFGIHADAGKIRAIADAFEPGIQMRHVKVGAEKTRDDHYRRVIAMRNSKAVVDGGGVEQEKFSAEQSFLPDGNI